MTTKKQSCFSKHFQEKMVSIHRDKCLDFTIETMMTLVKVTFHHLNLKLKANRISKIIIQDSKWMEISYENERINSLPGLSTVICQDRLQCHAKIALIKTIIISSSLVQSMKIIVILSFKYPLKAVSHMMSTILNSREVSIHR